MFSCETMPTPLVRGSVAEKIFRCVLGTRNANIFYLDKSVRAIVVGIYCSRAALSRSNPMARKFLRAALR